MEYFTSYNRIDPNILRLNSVLKNLLIFNLNTEFSETVFEFIEEHHEIDLKIKFVNEFFRGEVKVWCRDLGSYNILEISNRILEKIYEKYPQLKL